MKWRKKVQRPWGNFAFHLCHLSGFRFAEMLMALIQVVVEAVYSLWQRIAIQASGHCFLR